MTALIYGHTERRVSLIRELLEDHEFAPTTVVSAERALEIFDENHPSVVIFTELDGNGISLVRDLRNRPEGKFTTLAAMVENDDLDRFGLPGDGAIDIYLTPPFERSSTMRAEVASIRRHADRSRRYRQTHEQRSEAEKKYQLLFDKSLDAIVVANTRREVTEANRAAADLFGYDVGELSLGDLYVDAEAGRQFWQQLERSGIVRGYELELEHRKGRRLQCILSGAAHRRAHDGTIYQIIIRDCTEERNLRQRVLETEQRFSAIFHSTFQFIGLLDVDGTLLEANEPALRFVGASRDEVVGRPFWETPWWSHSDDARRRLRHSIDRAGRGQMVRFETEHLSDEGREMIVDFTLTPVTDETGEVIFIVPEGRDVTSQRRVEREMMEMHEKTRRQVGHDLQEWLGQMLTGITMITESLKRDLERESSDLAQKADDILRFVQEADEFTHHLSRGVLPVELDAEGLSTALERLAEQCRETYDIECSFEEEGEVLVADNTISTSLYWLTQEAIENAVSTGKASRVRITLTKTDRHIRLVVRDNGVMPAENVDIFMREDRDLRLMQYRARLMGGFLDVRTLSSGGRLFTCTVPLEAVGEAEPQGQSA